MSLKPLKASDQRKLDSIMQKRKRTTETVHKLPPYTYIICEGTKTEPHYISGLVTAINRKYYNYSSSNRIIVKGTGRNTKSLLVYAREQVKIDLPQSSIVWLMYDKDDFPDDDFDNTEDSAQNRLDGKTYKVAWSNECIELWFILHFQDLTVNVGRVQYQQILKRCCNYAKNQENIYDILKDKTAVAIERAKVQYVSYENRPPSQCCPATRVFELVEELQSYLKE